MVKDLRDFGERPRRWVFAARQEEGVEPNTRQDTTRILERLSNYQGMGGIAVRMVIDAGERWRRTQVGPEKANSTAVCLVF